MENSWKVNKNCMENVRMKAMYEYAVAKSQF